MMDQDLFSVIVVVYCNQHYLPDSVRSVLQQDYPAIELIVVDDGSEDFDTESVHKLIESLRRDNLQAVDILHNSENLGTVKSVNRALARAHGRYIKLLAADDMLYDASVLQNAKRVLDMSRDGLIASHVIGCSPSMMERGLFRDAFLKDISTLDAWGQYKRFCTRNRVTACGVFFRRDFFERNGLIDEQYHLLEDWPTWLRVTRNGVRFEVGDFIGARYRENVGSATGIVASYLEDKERAFKTEIRPYRRQIGWILYSRAWLTLRVRNAKLTRMVFGLIFLGKGR